MDSRRCELCQSPGKLICFCRKAILCELCIGKHFLAEPSLSHKPINLSQTEATRVYEENIHTLHRSEERLIEEAHLRQAIAKVTKEKVIVGIAQIDAAAEEIHKVTGRLKDAILRQVETECDQAVEEFVEKCAQHRNTLQTALRHLEGTETHNDNVVVLALRDVKTVEQADTVELVKWRVDATAVNVSNDVRRAIVAIVEVAGGRPAGSRLQEHGKRPTESKILAKSGPGKKPLYKPAPASTRPKSSNSLNTSTTADLSLDASKLTKLLGALKQGRGSPPPSNSDKREQAERRRTVHEGEFQGTPEVKGSSNEESGEDSEEEKGVRRKLSMEVADTHASSRPASRLTTLQSARAKTRQTLLQETARRVDDIAEQVKGLKSSPRTTGYQTRAFVLPEQQPDPDCEDAAERKISFFMVTDGEKDRIGSLKTGETSLTPTQQLSLAITRAAEVSKALISKPDMKPSSPRSSLTPSPPDPSLQAYRVLSGSKQLRILSLESNNYTVRAVALPDDQVFGEETAWCLSPANKLFFFGGKSPDGTSKKTIYEYDPVTGDTETGYCMLAGRFRHTAVFLGDTVYVCGGVGGPRGAMKDCERFDPAMKTTKRIGGLTVSREGHGSCCYSGAVYVAGGTTLVDFVERLTGESEAFYAVHVSTMIGRSASLIAFKDRILILHKDSVSHFSPENRSLRQVGTMNERDWWSGGQAVVLSRTAYLWLGDCVYRLDGDRSQLERVEGT